MSIGIVVSRYNENVDWTNTFSNVIIYNKGDPLPNTIPLPNVGREGHTYYKHIYDNYDNLHDYTIFLQGNPFDHSPNIIANLNRCKNINSEFEFLSEKVINSNFEYECARNWECKHIYTTWKRIFGTELEKKQQCIFGAGAQFIVSKRRILTKPKEFYKNIVDILGYTICPTEGYDIERFHKYIFE